MKNLKEILKRFYQAIKKMKLIHKKIKLRILRLLMRRWNS